MRFTTWCSLPQKAVLLMSLLLREWPAAKGLLADIQVVPKVALSAKTDEGVHCVLEWGHMRGLLLETSESSFPCLQRKCLGFLPSCISITKQIGLAYSYTLNLSFVHPSHEFFKFVSHGGRFLQRDF